MLIYDLLVTLGAVYVASLVQEEHASHLLPWARVGLGVLATTGGLMFW